MQDVILREKVLLDQFASGLEILGFRDAMQSHSGLFRELFVKSKLVSPEQVLGILNYPVNLNLGETTVRVYFEEYIRSSSPEKIESFLTFTTGHRFYRNLGLERSPSILMIQLHQCMHQLV